MVIGWVGWGDRICWQGVLTGCMISWSDRIC